MTRVAKPREPRGRTRFLAQEERERLLDECKKSPLSLLYPIVVLALSTGMRKGEVMNLRWEDVDPDLPYFPAFVGPTPLTTTVPRIATCP
jgi:integrase